MDVALVMGVLIAGITIGIVTAYDRFKQEKNLEINITRWIPFKKGKLKIHPKTIFDKFMSLKTKKTENGNEKIQSNKDKFINFNPIRKLSKSFRLLSLPKRFSLSLPSGILKSKQEKIKEIDMELEKVVKETPSESKKDINDTDDLDKKMVEEKMNDFDVDDTLLNEMETAERIEDIGKYSDDVESFEDLNSDNAFETDDLDFEYDIKDEDVGEDSNETDEDNEVEIETVKVDFDEKDDLLSSLQKEISVKKEEKLDLLRDLRNENLDLNELEKDLKEVLEALKSYAKISGKG